MSGRKFLELGSRLADVHAAGIGIADALFDFLSGHWRRTRGLVRCNLAAHHEAPVAGKQQFQNNCAACHGLDGKGAGPVASFLTKPPADLTKISARNNGEFPAVKLMEIIDGRREVKVHGPRDMPVWGNRLGSAAEGAGTESEKLMAKGDIQAIVSYLKTIQE